jgi:hypothetical protein
MRPLILDWKRFDRLTEARAMFGNTACLYVQADPEGWALRVGKASGGLHARYRGGTGWAIDAAMHNSRNVVFVASVPADLLEQVESTLIWTYRESLLYNQVGKRVAPTALTPLVHRGNPPTFVTWLAVA